MMRRPSLYGLRRGATMVELLLFVVIIAVSATALVPILFSSTEDRLLQQTISLVEQGGNQIIQTIGQDVRHAEEIILPELGGTGSILHLQTGSGGTNPTVIGISSGSIVLVRGTKRQVISTTQVAVENLIFTNTSTADHQSVLVQFSVSRTIRLQSPRSYGEDFEAIFSPFPDDARVGALCGCASPGCAGASSYVWQVCVEGTCETTQTQLQCP